MSPNARADALLYLYTLLQYSVLPEGIGILVEQLNHRSILGLETPFLSAELGKKRNKSATSTENRTRRKPNKPKNSHSSYDPAECCGTSSCPGTSSP